MSQMGSEKGQSLRRLGLAEADPRPQVLSGNSIKFQSYLHPTLPSPLPQDSTVEPGLTILITGW